MPGFAKPSPAERINISAEKAAINEHFRERRVPASTRDRLLLCSWNIANLGDHDRPGAALEICAHLLRRFDLIAVQEVKEDARDFQSIVERMGSSFDFVMSDTAGNNERLAFVYRTGKVELGQLFGELALPARRFPKRTVRVPYRKSRQDRVQTFRDMRFEPFDRNPFIGNFRCHNIDLTLVNCHLYYGAKANSSTEKDRKKYARRVLELYALARWADDYAESPHTYDPDVVLLGDMNVPAMHEQDPAYDALTDFGWQPQRFGTIAGGMTNIRNSKTYDQVVFAPGDAESRVRQSGVFDFDNAVMKSRWRRLLREHEGNTRKASTAFFKYIQFYYSDHRLIWMQLDAS